MTRIFSIRFAVAFMALVFVFGQLHELSHLTAAYLVCGEPGRQADFNFWTLAPGCNGNRYAWVTSVAGPLFSYLVMWVGCMLLYLFGKRFQNAGLLLVLTNLPFARIFTAAMGSGDETTMLTLFYGNILNMFTIRLLGFVIVLFFSLPPLIMCFNSLMAPKRSWIFVALVVLPMPVMFGYEFKLLGMVIKAGILTKAHILGVPDVIFLHTALMALLAWILKDDLKLTKLPALTAADSGI